MDAGLAAGARPRARGRPLERLLGIDWEHGSSRRSCSIPDVVKAMNVFYFVGHFVLTGVFFVWLYHRSRAGLPDASATAS